MKSSPRTALFAAAIAALPLGVASASAPTSGAVRAVESLPERVMWLIATQLEVAPDKVRREANLRDDLNPDSLKLVELLLALEEDFEFEDPTTEGCVPPWVTVGDVIDYVAVASVKYKKP